MEVSRSQIHAILYYEFSLGLKAAEAQRKVAQVFGQKTVSESSVRGWFAKFRSGDIALEDKPRTGRPLAIDRDLLDQEVKSDPSTTCEILAEKFKVSAECIRVNLHALGKSYKLNRWVPYDLTLDQKFRRVSLCSYLLDRLKNEPFITRLLTSDEKWVMYDNSTRSCSWLDKGAASGSTAKPSIHSKKVLLCVWWNGHGIMHYELLRSGQTVTAELYVQQLERVQEQLRIKCPGLVNRGKVFYLHDNARPHVAKIVREKLLSLDWEVLPHPAYSPDLAPSDYHLFLSLSNFLRDKKFDEISNVNSALNEFFDSKTLEFYRRGLTKLPERWQKCIDAEGAYFE